MLTRKMKDSGIEWIGKIPEDWNVVKLKNIISFINGFAFKSNQFTTEKTNANQIITISSFNHYKIDEDKITYSIEKIDKLYNYELKENDILFAMSGGTVGKNLYIDEIPGGTYFINQRVGIIRSKINKLIYFNLNNKIFDEYTKLLSAGSAQPNISGSDIGEFRITLPPAEKIQKLSYVLDNLESKVNNIITETKQSIEELKKYKQSLITEAVTKGLDPNVEMKDSGIKWIGKIPKHWFITRPNRISTIVRGNSAFQKSDMEKTGEYVAVQYGQVYKLNELDDKYQLYIDEEFYKDDQVVQKGDTILVSTSETIEDLGHSCFYNRKDIGLLGGEQLCLKPNKKVLFDKFLYYATTYFNLELNQYATGLKVYRFKLDDLKKINMIVPPTIEEQRQIVSYLDEQTSRIDKLIEDKTKVIEELENYKKFLIYEYVTGKKEV